MADKVFLVIGAGAGIGGHAAARFARGGYHAVLWRLMLVSPSCNANYLLRGGYKVALWRLMLVSPSCNASYLLRGGYHAVLSRLS